jgi:hypothetical protein
MKEFEVLSFFNPLNYKVICMHIGHIALWALALERLKSFMKLILTGY